MRQEEREREREKIIETEGEKGKREIREIEKCKRANVGT
jgi:hypothetical protein